VLILFVGLVLQATQIEAQAHAPVRSGTVLNPGNVTGPANCSIHADCAAWLEARCDPRLAGVDPAAFTSIVDVRALAGSDRHIHASGAFGRWLSGSVYEFWSARCTRVGSVSVEGGAAVTIPEDAVWMTAPGQTGPYHWELW
jgi:hypothetical protein